MHEIFWVQINQKYSKSKKYNASTIEIFLSLENILSNV